MPEASRSQYCSQHALEFQRVCTSNVVGTHAQSGRIANDLILS